ncbi:MAG: hypothetical protein FJX28_06810 [Alphaproteobacteria bacterium]|nr:hypothetical protein [Alphaproteobacteria bacterium]
MSNPDSFIDEVTEEVRRDRLYAMFRKYGWIGGLLVLGIVGGAAYVEWEKSKAVARAEGFGEAMLDALDVGGTAERRAAMAAVPADGTQAALKALMLASDPASDLSQSKAEALAALEALIADASQPEIYRDMATLRRVMVAGADLPLADRRAALEGISAPGRTFRVMAAEQLAYLLIEEGKAEGAIAALSALMQDQEATQGVRSRAAQMITALGGSLPDMAEPVPDQG